MVLEIILIIGIANTRSIKKYVKTLVIDELLTGLAMFPALDYYLFKAVMGRIDIKCLILAIMIISFVRSW